MDLPYKMYDADNHLYEATDAFTRYLPDHRKQDLFWVRDERGHRHIVMNGSRWDYIPNPTFDPISKAGSLTEMFSGESSRAHAMADGMRAVEPLSLRPEYLDPDARIKRLYQQGVEACLLFPTLASGVEEYTREDLGLQTDVLWAFNRWLDAEWGFARDGRMFTTPIISLADVDQAIAMLEWALSRGCKAIDMRPAPVTTETGMKSPGDTQFDPFWARCQEAGTLVCSHLGESGYYRYSGDWSGNYRRKAFALSPFEHVYLHGRPISDFLTALVCHGVFARHPSLRVVSVENGSDWVPHLVERFKMYYHRYPGAFPDDPVEAFERCVWMSPYWEEKLDELTAYIPVEHIMAGSDFPHAEGLSDPTDFVKGLAGFSADDVRRIMRENLKALL